MFYKVFLCFAWLCMFCHVYLRFLVFFFGARWLSSVLFVSLGCCPCPFFLFALFLLFCSSIYEWRARDMFSGTWNRFCVAWTLFNKILCSLVVEALAMKRSAVVREGPLCMGVGSWGLRPRSAGYGSAWPVPWRLLSSALESSEFIPSFCVLCHSCYQLLWTRATDGCLISWGTNDIHILCIYTNI